MKALYVLALASVVSLTTVPAFARGGSHASSHGANIYSGTGSNSSSHYTHGYTTKSGTYVAPHYSTNPNSTKRDNYNTKNNYNPHTGEYGTRLVDK